MGKKLVIMAALVGLAFSAFSAWAADGTIEGTVNGYTCTVLGKACPVDREDPVIAAEKIFVVVKADGSYYMVPNVDRAILARHLTEKVKVTGAIDEKYKSVIANKLETHVAASGKWKTVWSPAMEAEARKMLNTW